MPHGEADSSPHSVIYRRNWGIQTKCGACVLIPNGNLKVGGVLAKYMVCLCQFLFLSTTNFRFFAKRTDLKWTLCVLLFHWKVPTDNPYQNHGVSIYPKHGSSLLRTLFCKASVVKNIKCMILAAANVCFSLQFEVKSWSPNSTWLHRQKWPRLRIWTSYQYVCISLPYFTSHTSIDSATYSDSQLLRVTVGCRPLFQDTHPQLRKFIQPPWLRWWPYREFNVFYHPLCSKYHLLTRLGQMTAQYRHGVCDIKAHGNCAIS